MKKAAAVTFFLFTLAVFLPWGTPKALAEKSGQVTCGDYELLTRKKRVDGQEREVLYRVNNKTGETWLLEDRSLGWVKLREQQTS